jgi:hypothetical protein
VSRWSRKRHPRRGLLLLTPILGLVVGGGLGLLVSWVLWPVEYTDVAPDSLYPAQRQEYIVLIAQNYAYERDLEAAQARLVALGDPTSIGGEVAALAERYVQQEPDSPYTAPIAQLALDLGYNRTVLAAYLFGVTPIATWTPAPTGTQIAASTPLPTETLVPTATSQPPTPTPAPADTATLMPTPLPTWTPSRTPRPTSTPLPTRTPTVTSTPEPRFDVIEIKRRCDLTQEQLMVMVRDAEGEQLPNVELLVRWDGGEDRFVTGLKPDVGLGYADFGLERGQSYQLVVIGAPSQVQRIAAEPCEGTSYLATWQVLLQWTGEPGPADTDSQ